MQNISSSLPSTQELRSLTDYQQEAYLAVADALQALVTQLVDGPNAAFKYPSAKSEWEQGSDLFGQVLLVESKGTKKNPPHIKTRLNGTELQQEENILFHSFI